MENREYKNKQYNLQFVCIDYSDNKVMNNQINYKIEITLRQKKHNLPVIVALSINSKRMKYGKGDSRRLSVLFR